MDNFTLKIHDRKGSADADLILKNLAGFNQRFRTGELWRELTITCKDKGGKLIAGLNGHTDWGWLFVKLLWVHEAHHARGLGAHLLRVAEAEAWGRGSRKVWLDTLNPKAKPFYLKQGYTVFAELPDCPAGQSRYFLQKNLVPPG